MIDRIRSLLINSSLSLQTDLDISPILLQIECLEKMADVELPRLFKDYLIIYTATKNNSTLWLGDFYLLSIKEVISNYGVWEDLVDRRVFDNSTIKQDKEIQAVWWDKGWIPISDDGRGNHFCLDMNPTVLGKKGQIIQVWHDDGVRKLIANSFEEWLSNIVITL